jgi:spore maturation protein CgeB
MELSGAPRMRILLLWVFYDEYLRRFYAARPAVAQLPYAQQQTALLDDYFGWPPAVGRRLAERGHDVEIIVANAGPLQRAWARETGVEFHARNWQMQLPLEQVRRFQPDVLWTGSNFRYFGEYLRALRQYCGAVVAWTAAPLPLALDLQGIDCMLTSHANFAATFRARGLRCEQVLPCFEPRILDATGEPDRDVAVSFIGGLTWAHLERIVAISAAARAAPLQIWSGKPKVLSRSAARPAFWKAMWAARALLRHAHPEVYGMDMYRVLARSQLSINVHAEVAGGLAGNMRMFEATGCGALLLTEQMPNLAELFEPGREVVGYSGSGDLIAKIRHYLDHPAEATLVASQGRKRTLRDHSTVARAAVLEAIFGDLRRIT